MLAAAPAYADEVVLGDGAVLTGDARTVGERVVVKMDLGTIVLEKSQVKEIRESKSPLEELEARRAKLAPSDLAGHRALAEWAEQQGLETQARSLWRRVVELQPNEARAREKLGEKLHEGKWLDEDELMEAKGFVRYFGEWLTPEQIKEREAQAATRRTARLEEERARAAKLASEREQWAAQKQQEEDDFESEKYWIAWNPWLSTPMTWSNPYQTKTFNSAVSRYISSKFNRSQNSVRPSLQPGVASKFHAVGVNSQYRRSRP